MVFSPGQRRAWGVEVRVRCRGGSLPGSGTLLELPADTPPQGPRPEVPPGCSTLPLPALPPPSPGVALNFPVTLGGAPEKLGGCLATPGDVVAKHLMGGGAWVSGGCFPPGHGCGRACPPALPFCHWVWTTELVFS